MGPITARRLASTLLLGSALAAPPGVGRAVAQDGLETLCASTTIGSAECYLAAASVRTVQPRIGTALWGGSPVPGTASTLGMRLGSFPRLSVSGRVALVPTTFPPLLDRSSDESSTAWLTALSGQATVGLLSGFSPLPTVGGVLSLDALARVSWASLPTDQGFDGSVWGWMLGLRLGALRESFTLPGISLTGAYGRSGTVTLGDGSTGDGFWRGSLSDLKATLAASKRVGPLGLTAGAAWDRYGSDVRLGYRTSATGPLAVEDAEAETERWSGFLNASWTFLVLHAAVEVGWQEAPEPEPLPAGVAVDPAGWWGGLAFRLSI